MTIEMYGSDEAGHLMLLPDAPPEAAAPPEDEPPLPGMASAAPPVAAPPVVAPADDLAALRRLIEEREQARAKEDARRDAQVETVTRVLAGQAPEAPAVAPPPAGPPARPKAEDFDTHEAYEQAQETWVDARAAHAARAEWQQAQTAQHREQWQQARNVVVKQAEDAFTVQHPDYRERVQGALAGKLAPHVHGALMLFDEAPQIAYTLAQDPALVQRLNSMPPPQLLYALGRLSATDAGAAAGGRAEDAGPGGDAPPAPASPAPPSPPRRLPAPPRPLSGTGVALPGGYRDDMSVAEYRAWREAQTH